MKALKLVGFIVLAAVLIVIVLGLVAPNHYSVERSIVIDAPQNLVFEHVKYWKNWVHWSAWAEHDSTMKVTVEGTDGTVDSKYVWQGDPKITGSGEIVNTGIIENEVINYYLHFVTPWESQSEGYVKTEPVDGKTKVTWGFYGDTKFPMNIFMIFQSMENMMAPDFDRGLQLLKEIVEKEYQKIQSYQVDEITFSATRFVTAQNELNISEIQSFFSQQFPALANKVVQANAAMAGSPSALYYTWDESSEMTKLAAAIPVRYPNRLRDVEIVSIPAGKAVKIDYYGPYENLGPAYKALDMYIVKNQLKLKMPVIEEYVTDPMQEPDPAKWLTKIYFLIE